ncbi:NAD(P)/FAD-dependent oxidoreductase [Patescibacteria group bacterium]|nr:NAD(P)/FAD-dependent oxidoreductase [Patescibacteria group bacterium]
MSEAVDQKNIDVIVIGAGPAGGQCARELAKMGYKVLLLEHSQEIGEPNYSTAGTTKETISEFELPQSVLSASWNKIYFESKNKKAIWEYDDPRGYVFNFADLKRFLVNEAVNFGADVMVGTAAMEIIKEEDNYVGIKYKGVLGEGEVRAKFIVDATGHWGFVNSKLNINNRLADDIVSGIELQVTAIPKNFIKTLAFFVGSQAPQGYGWVFPMEDNKASKIGIGSIGQLDKQYNTKEVLKNFLRKFEHTKKLEPIEIHGGGGYVNSGVKNHGQKNIILIGDAAFTANALAYEGIRHAMKAGRLAAQSINEVIKNKQDNNFLKNIYQTKWQEIFARRWYQSYLISKLVYHKFTDDDWDSLIEGLGKLSPADAFDIFFNYQYELMLKVPRLVWLLSRKLPKIFFK